MKDLPDELWKKFFRYEKKHGISLAMVNLYREPELKDWLVQRNLEWFYLYKGLPPEEILDMVPAVFVMEADHPFQERLEALLDHESCIFLKIQPGKDPFAAASHLSGLTQARLPEGKEAWLRFYEPWVLETLLGIADFPMLTKLYGDIVQSFWIPMKYRAACSLHEATEGLPPSSPGFLELSPGHYEKILEAQQEHFVAKLSHRLRQERSPSVEILQGKNLEEYVEETLDHAVLHGITGRKNMTDFVLFAGVHGLHWYHEERIREILHTKESQEKKMRRIKLQLDTEQKNIEEEKER